MDGATLLAVLLTVQAVPFWPKEKPELRPPERPIMGHAAQRKDNKDAKPPAEQPQAVDKKAGPQIDFDLTADALRNDARLSDVCFVDPRHGWAVGDRGTIWHTDDGGRRWTLQDSGVACPLLSVCFLDAQVGWAAGGYAHPYAQTSSGVVLATRDGGLHWQQVLKTPLPAVRRIRFSDDRRGWAVGASSAMFPGGVFVTDSGGQGWMPIGGDQSDGWTAADLIGGHSGVLAGRDGQLAALQQGAVRPVETPPLGLRTINQVKLAGPRLGWAIGDDGLILTTGDCPNSRPSENGTVPLAAKGDSPVFADTRTGTVPLASWQPPPGTIPAGVLRQFDFMALAARGQKVWIAGSPGTRVFHSPDAGRSWTSFLTNSCVPIHALSFADDQNGWAVGALGTILATADGGRTWRPQHAGGTRAALLGLFSQPEDVPLELLARLSGNDGYLGVVEVLNRGDIEVKPRDEVHADQRVREALVAVGGCDGSLAARFPVRQPGLQLSAEQIIDGWNRACDGRGMGDCPGFCVSKNGTVPFCGNGIEELHAHLVRRIRAWRPDVIVTHDASPRGDDPLRHLVNQLVLQAVRDAADPRQFPEQATHAALEPWQVKKVFAALPPSAHGSTDLTTAQLATRLGRSLADAAAVPRGLLRGRYAPSPPTLGFRLLSSPLTQQQGERDFFTGIVLQPGGEARREPLDPPAESLGLLRRAADKGRNLRAILEKTEKDARGSEQLLGQAGEMIVDLDPASAGLILYQLGDSYHRTGRWELAADTFTMLTTRYPNHPLSRPALAWLVQYYASGEAAARALPAPQSAVRQASTFPADNSRQSNRFERAAEFGKIVEQSRPELAADPAVRFALAAACRARGDTRQAERYLALQARGANRDAWWACAQGEASLNEKRGTPPKTVLSCIPAEAKPRLDGRLDDPVWQRAKSAPLQSPLLDDDQWPAAVMLSYDAEFLYVAVKCRQAPGVKYDATAGPRPRDADLAARDRVEICLDMDRDFTTYYRLSIDHRGWTADECWGDRSWNPQWFVAAAGEDGHWTAEAAIPWEQLTRRAPQPGDTWALGIQRIVPGLGFQSWTTPAAANVVPEGFGYLRFE